MSLALALCAFGQAGAQERAYKLGWVQGLSGPGSAFADSAQQGIETAIDEINANNLAGRKFQLITADDAGDPRTAADVCNRLVLQDKVDAIVGFSSTPARIACNQAAQKGGIPFMGAAGGITDICAPNMFADGPAPNQQIEPMVGYMMKQGMKTFFLYGNDYAAPHTVLGLARKYIVDHGGTVLGESYAPIGTSDFSVDLGKIGAAKPDAVLVGLFPGDQVTFHRQFANEPRVAGIKRGDSFPFEGAVKILGPAAAGVYTGGQFFATLTDPETKKFTAAVRAKYGDKAQVAITTYLSYVGARLIAAAVKQAGPDGAAVTKALDKVTLDAPGGQLTMSKHNPIMTIYIGEGVGDGTIKILDKTGPIAANVNCNY
jgi:ABC-type branched-subunit amino acid transport system substrate-binding protein